MDNQPKEIDIVWIEGKFKHLLIDGDAVYPKIYIDYHCYTDSWVISMCIEIDGDKWVSPAYQESPQIDEKDYRFLVSFLRSSINGTKESVYHEDFKVG